MKIYESWQTKSLKKAIKVHAKWLVNLSRLRYIPVPDNEIMGLAGEQLAAKIQQYRDGYLGQGYFQLKLMQEELDKRHGKS